MATICPLFLALSPPCQGAGAERSWRLVCFIYFLWMSSDLCVHAQTDHMLHRRITHQHVFIIKEIKKECLAGFLCTTGWHCSSSLCMLSSTPSLPPYIHSSLALSLRLLVFCRRKIRIAREHNEDYQIDIGDNLFLPSLLHGLFLHFPLLSASVTHLCSVVNLCFHPLPFKSLIAPGRIWENEGEGESEGEEGGDREREGRPGVQGGR